jgi:protoporphyrin/coproporphyrin ferrochelatase
MNAVTNDSDPKDEPPDDPRTDSELDAAIRELDRLRCPESWTVPVAGGQHDRAGPIPADPAAAETETADPAHEPGHTYPESATSDPWDEPGAEHASFPTDEGDDDLFGPEPASAPSAELAEQPRGEDAEMESEAPFAAEPLADPDTSAPTEERTRALSDFDEAPADTATDRPSDLIPLATSHLPRAGNLLSASSDPADVSPPETQPADLPRRMFGLRRALDAHRLGVSIEGLPREQDAAPATAQTAVSQPEPDIMEPAAPETAAALTAGAASAVAAAVPRAESKGWFGRRKTPAPEPRPLPQPQSRSEPAEPELSPAITGPIADALAAEAERRGWFIRRRQPAPAADAATPAAEAPRPKSDPPEPEPLPAETDPFAAMQAAIGTQPKRERHGWFGAKRRKAPDAAEAPARAREMVDLAPVREAMQAAALKRGPAVAGVSDEALGARPAEAGRVGVLLVNLGTPDAPKPRAVRRYLREFLSDRRVIEKDSFTWQLVFRGIILPFRPRRKARAYRSIWNQEKNESPLKTITRAQAEKLGEALTAAGADTVVDWAMRYGNPSLESRIKALIAQGCERILLAPLYPQYSSATTATVCDEAFRVLSRIRNQPALRVAPPYYADPMYIEAIASSVRAELGKLSFEPEVIVASYHGMPQEYVQKGDPYYRHCTRTTELLRERLGISQSNFVMTFQSRFGRAEWLQPYTDQTLRKLAKDGVKNVAVVTPGFAADCLETLEEIAIENAHLFRKRGGKNFAFIPCLNDSERGMLVIRELATRELRGWV